MSGREARRQSIARGDQGSRWHRRSGAAKRNPEPRSGRRSPAVAAGVPALRCAAAGTTGEGKPLRGREATKHSIARGDQGSRRNRRSRAAKRNPEPRSGRRSPRRRRGSGSPLRCGRNDREGKWRCRGAKRRSTPSRAATTASGGTVVPGPRSGTRNLDPGADHRPSPPGFRLSAALRPERREGKWRCRGAKRRGNPSRAATKQSIRGRRRRQQEKPSFRGREAEPGTSIRAPITTVVRGSGSPLRCGRNDGKGNGDVGARSDEALHRARRPRHQVAPSFRGREAEPGTSVRAPITDRRRRGSGSSLRCGRNDGGGESHCEGAKRRSNPSSAATKAPASSRFEERPLLRSLELEEFKISAAFSSASGSLA